LKLQRLSKYALLIRAPIPVKSKKKEKKFGENGKIIQLPFLQASPLNSSATKKKG